VRSRLAVTQLSLRFEVLPTVNCSTSAVRRRLLPETAPVPRRLTAFSSLIVAWRTSAARAALEACIRSTYAAAHGATIRHFLPLLLGLSGDSGELLGAIGAQPGREPGRMFLETYLDEPVEAALSRALGQEAPRVALAEVGNLAAVEPGTGLALVSTLAAYLDGLGVSWAVFTATDALRGRFLRCGLELADLGPADGHLLGEQLADWGRYYETAPRVTAAHIGSLRKRLARDERLAERCSAVWDEALRQGRLHDRDAA